MQHNTAQHSSISKEQQVKELTLLTLILLGRLNFRNVMLRLSLRNSMIHRQKSQINCGNVRHIYFQRFM